MQYLRKRRRWLWHACMCGMQVPLAWPTGSARATLEIVESAVVSEVRQAFVGWGTLTTRLWRGARAVEVEWTAGPVPIADGVGKEVALRLRSDLDTGLRHATLCSCRPLTTCPRWPMAAMCTHVQQCMYCMHCGVYTVTCRVARGT